MIPALIITAFNLILYWPTIFMDYVMDDNNLSDTLKDHAKRGVPYYGPLTNLATLRTRFYGCGTFGLNTKVDHGFTLLLWTVLNVMIYFAFGHNLVSLCAALLCSCHPLMNNISIWLNGRRYLICAVMLMVCMLTWPWALPFYLLAAAYQYTIFFAPVLFFNKVPLYIMPFLLVPIGIMAALVYKIVKQKIDARASIIASPDLKGWHPKRPIIVTKIFGFYFWKMVIPQRVQMVYPFLQMFGRTQEGNDEAYRMDADFYRGIGAILVCGAIIFMLPMDYKPWAVFMVLSLLQWCAIVPVLQLVADRYASIPTIFMCFFISYFALNYLPLAWGLTLIGGLMGACICYTRQVFFMYRNLDAWYDYHCYDDFSNLAVMNLRIGMLLGKHKIWQAQALLEHALSYYPKDYALNYLGYILSMIMQAPPMAQKYIDVCRDNIYIGEESFRKGEVDDAQLAIRIISGEKNVAIPPHLMMKNQPKKG